MEQRGSGPIAHLRISPGHVNQSGMVRKGEYGKGADNGDQQPNDLKLHNTLNFENDVIGNVRFASNFGN